MRRIISIGLAAVLTLGLAACGSSEESTDSAVTTELPAWDNQELKTVKENNIVRLEFPQVAPPKELVTQIVEEGTGKEVTETDFVLANYTGQVWGKTEHFDSSYERGTPTGFSLERVIAGWTQGLTGLKVGTKVILVIPPDLGYGNQGGQPSAGIGATDVIAFYIEIVDAYSKDQGGDPQATPEANLEELPVNIGGELGSPVTVLVKENEPEPTELQTIVVAKGKGEPLGGEGTTVYAQYSMTYWDNSASETTYGRTGPMNFVIGGQSIFNGLTGVPVGSRVLILSPRIEGNDSREVASIAVVVDILGQYPAPKAAQE